ncbi:MAG: V-type ATPase subunit [Methanospirillaceae archaeon]|nr:V-type ATPase subunit [Methanospirillaceae archaeon]
MNDLLFLFGQVQEGIFLLSAFPLIILLVIGTCFFVFAGLCGFLPTILTIAGSTYPVARAKTLGTPYIQEGILDNLLDSGAIEEILAKIEASGFLTRKSPEEMRHSPEIVLERNEIEQFQTFISSVPSDFNPFFTSYQQLYEIRMIKRILRMLYHCSDCDATKEKLFPVGILKPDIIDGMRESPGLEDSLHLLSQTPYQFLLSLPLLAYHEQKSLIAFDIALDQFWADDLYASCTRIQSTLVTPFLEFTRIFADLTNIRTLIRGKHAGLSTPFISSCTLSMGKSIPQWRVTQLNELMSVPDLVRELGSTEYGPYLEPVLTRYPDPGSLTEFDLALDQILLMTLGRISRVYYFTGGPLIRFMLAKEYEYRNLRIIINGIMEKGDRDTIKNLLVHDIMAG